MYLRADILIDLTDNRGVTLDKLLHMQLGPVEENHLTTDLRQ